MTPANVRIGRPVRLLVAEDEWLIVERIERALEGSRYLVAAKVASMDQLEALLGTADFDGVILDGNLDGVRTHGVAERLMLAQLPLLLLTAYDARRWQLDAARVARLRKPFADRSLIEHLDSLIGIIDQDSCHLAEI